MTATFEERFQKLKKEPAPSFEERFNKLSNQQPQSFEERFTRLAKSEATPAPEEERPYSGQYAHLTKSQYEQLAPEEKKRLQEYVPLTGFAKGLASGVSLSLTERIPGLSPKEGEVLTGLGDFFGSVLPISKLYNVLGKPLVSIASKSPKYAKGLEALARMTGFGLTGAAYEGTKETIKTGEVPKPEELLRYGAQWVAFDAGLQALGKAAQFSKRLLDYSKAKNISQKDALNQIMQGVEKSGIDIAKEPEKAILESEKLLEEIDHAPEKSPSEEIGKDGKVTSQEEFQPSQGAEAKTIDSSKIGDVASEAETAAFKISPAPHQISAKKIPEAPTPITETTGKGAAERIEYPKSGVDKILDRMNSYIQEAKTPVESLKRRGEVANAAIFNFLAPLEKLEAEIPVPEKVSTRIKLAQSAASEINSVLENGIYSNLTGRFEHEGLKSAYGDFAWKKLTKNLKPHEYSLEELDTLRTSKAALKRQAEGKKTGIDTQKAKADIQRLLPKYEPISQRIRDFQKATLDTYGQDLLGKDLIEKWNKDYYSPLYRVMEEGKDSILRTGSLLPKQPFKKMVGSQRKIIPPSESDPYNVSMLVRNSKNNEAILQYRKLVEEGKLPGKIKPGRNEPIPDNVVENLEIDPSLKPVAEALYNQSRKSAFTPEKNVLRGWKEGKPFTIEVPEEIYNVFSTIAPQERGPLAKLFSATNRLFSRGISMEPRKFASILGRDALSSLIYSKTGSNPMSVVEALGDVFRDKHVYKEFLALGGDVYASRLAERIDRAKKIEDLITPGKEGLLVPFEKMGDFFRKYAGTLGDISISVPLAEYKRALEKFGNTPEGRIMAAMEARRVTYDPTRKGGSKTVREMGNFIPFWNVSLQDLSSVARNLKSPEAYAKGMLAISLPTLTLKAINEANPEYQDLTPVDKAAFWHVYLGDKHLRIPIPWLLGTAFKVSAEAFYDTTHDMMSKGDPRAKEAWEGIYSNFAENVSGSLPPLAKIYMEQTTGKSPMSPVGAFFGTESRAPEVVPRRLQDLQEKFQYTSKTSQLARKFGELWNFSPAKIDRVIKGLGTNVAASALALTDEIAYFTGLAEDKRPEQNEANYLMLGNFVSNSPPNRTKYMNEFYEYLNEATKDKKTRDLIRKKGMDDASITDLKYNTVPIFRHNRNIQKAFRDMRAIEDSDEYTPTEKKHALDKIQKDINTMYKIAVEEVRAAKKQES